MTEALTRLLTGRLRRAANKISYWVECGYHPQGLARVTEGWSCHQLRLGLGGAGRHTTLQKFSFIQVVRNIRHPRKNVKCVVDYESVVWEEHLDWRYKLGSFVGRMAFESTGSPNTKIWTMDHPTSRGQGQEEESAEEMGKVEKKPKSIVSWKSN